MRTIYVSRCGFSLLELLVVISIFLVLFSLLFSAVQRIRNSALTTSCQSNLKQLSLALHHYHANQNFLPPGVTLQNNKHPQPYLSWLARILPYIEQDELWRITESAFKQDVNFLNNPPHNAASIVVKTFGCPADSRTSRVGKWNMAFTSYLGNAGISHELNNGAFYMDSKISFSNITDGLNSTLLLGERPPSADETFGWWYAGHGQARCGSAEFFLGVVESMVHSDYFSLCTRGPYRFQPGKIDNNCSTFHFWSLHSSGGNFAMSDGSVRFFQYSSYKIFPALSTRAGNEQIDILD